MPRGSTQTMCLEEGPGSSGGHVELQVTQPALPPLEFILPQRPELAQAESFFPGVTSAVELSPPLLTGQVQRPAGQASSDAV
ncbi:anomalous homeobox protein-like [Tenrec ecaudatus]|uniref:anomalous homeobox protein-like n=1 Tax=Tenrec ecaudatus TaxID=94439 RepID=UPI003F5964F8